MPSRYGFVADTERRIRREPARANGVGIDGERHGGLEGSGVDDGLSVVDSGPTEPPLSRSRALPRSSMATTPTYERLRSGWTVATLAKLPSWLGNTGISPSGLR